MYENLKNSILLCICHRIQCIGWTHNPTALACPWLSCRVILLCVRRNIRPFNRRTSLAVLANHIHFIICKWFAQGDVLSPQKKMFWCHVRYKIQNLLSTVSDKRRVQSYSVPLVLNALDTSSQVKLSSFINQIRPVRTPLGLTLETRTLLWESTLYKTTQKLPYMDCALTI